MAKVEREGERPTPMIEDLFLHEDTSKPENRINLAIFGLMCVGSFREWMQERLGLPSEAVLYPTANVIGAGVRPDFAVRHATTEETLAWIEVECGRDQEQLDRFRQRLAQPVKAIWGRRSDGADLSLEEMAEFLERLDSSSEPQVRWNAEHLRLQIVEALDGRRREVLKDAPVSDAVRDSPFVQALTSELGDRLSFEIAGNMRPGEIRANTKKAAGFSLRVYSRVVKGNHSLSVLNQTGGRPEVWFQSKEKMLRCLPHRAEVVERLAALVSSMGGDMEAISERGKTAVPIARAERSVADLARITRALADL